MISYLKFRFELYKLEQTTISLDKNYKEVKRSFDCQPDNGHLSSLEQELQECERTVEFIKSAHYKREANKYLIPMPDASEVGIYTSFDFGDETGSVTYLTSKGIYLLRKLIREEKKIKREAIGFYFTICTGLIGAIIGLLSVLPS
ncbi:hypothetical protein AB6C99_22620 [Vibrio cyclitrophicus]